MFTIDDLKTFAMTMERVNGSRPHIVLACAGAADEHWQLFNMSADTTTPQFVIADGTIMIHPDYPDQAVGAYW